MSQAKLTSELDTMAMGTCITMDNLQEYEQDTIQILSRFFHAKNAITRLMADHEETREPDFASCLAVASLQLGSREREIQNILVKKIRRRLIMEKLREVVIIDGEDICVICLDEIEIGGDEVFIAYMMGNLFFSNGAISLRAGYLAALTDYDILGASGFDWGTPIMAALYRGLDEVSVSEAWEGDEIDHRILCGAGVLVLRVQDYGVQATGDPRDMGWFMDVAGLNDQRRQIPIPVMHVPYTCPPTYSTDELWHQNQGLRYAAYEDSRQLTDINTELRRELSRAQEAIRETSDRLAEMSISY
ncbi:hypothetical protein GIB67_022301 [Kingdonia uniflora]|uniref:Uncharacterized protein n=1 Tax=Kingdonia uniflora TaxID=39325 RepID=A0A7J7KW22_9MAGN|nr:hypothetical protein GIB67_022301 [Kingdonia uniflora]